MKYSQVKNEVNQLKLIFNENEVDLELYNTNFVDRWVSWAFDRSNEITLDFNKYSIEYLHNKWLDVTYNLNNILEKVNSISVKENLPDKWYYDFSYIYDTDFLQRIHEQWAEITKQSLEVHLPIFDQNTKKIYDTINTKLHEQSMDYSNINNAVHDVEFLYKFFLLHSIKLNKDTLSLNEYKIKPEDTGFIKDSVSIPFYDIGRPQYEKYRISGKVDHPEISHYQNLVDIIEIQSSAQQEPVLETFIDECNKNNVPCWGPYVSIARNKSNDNQLIGYNIIKNFNQNGNNTLLLKKI